MQKRSRIAVAVCLFAALAILLTTLLASPFQAAQPKSANWFQVSVRDPKTGCTAVRTIFVEKEEPE